MIEIFRIMCLTISLNEDKNKYKRKSSTFQWNFLYEVKLEKEVFTVRLNVIEG